MASDSEFSMTSDQPYYLPLADEIDVFQAAYAARLPVLLKGYRLRKNLVCRAHDLVIGSANREPRTCINYRVLPRDLTATDMVDYLLKGDETIYLTDMTRAVRSGAICYLMKSLKPGKIRFSSTH